MRVKRSTLKVAMISTIVILALTLTGFALADPEPTACAPGDTGYQPHLDLSANLAIDWGSLTTTATINNSSTECAYDVGAAAYKKFDENIDNQEIFDHEQKVVDKEGQVVITLDLPVVEGTPLHCATQIDAFWGDVILSFEGGVRYANTGYLYGLEGESRLLKANHTSRNAKLYPYCDTPVEPVCQPVAVVSYSPGTNNDGSPLLAYRTDPNKAIDPPTIHYWGTEVAPVAGTDNTKDFVTLGKGGYAVFDFGALTTPQDILEIIETSWGDRNWETPAWTCEHYPEYLKVYVKAANGDYSGGGNPESEGWVPVGRGCRDAAYPDATGKFFQYILVVDDSQWGAANYTGGAVDGFDLNMINLCGFETTVIEPVCEPEVVIYDETTQGTQHDGDPLPAVRTNLDNIFGDDTTLHYWNDPIVGVDGVYNFITLGKGGFAVWDYGQLNKIQDGEQLQILETSWGDHNGLTPNWTCGIPNGESNRYPEFIDVYVAKAPDSVKPTDLEHGALLGAGWEHVGNGCRDQAYPGADGKIFQYLLIVDRSYFGFNNYSGNNVDGFDINRVELCGLPIPPPPPQEGDESCSHGFWKINGGKDRIEDWLQTPYGPGDLVTAVFGQGPAGVTLDEALKYGGPDAEQKMYREAVAALLNASHPNVNYPLSVGDVLAQVSAAYAPDGSFSSTHTYLESLNNHEANPDLDAAPICD